MENNNVTFREVPVPPSSHSAAYVLVPVISALVVVSLLVIGGVYYVNLRRRRGTHIEAADFQFHSSIQRTTNDGWFLTNVKDVFRTIFSSPDNDKIIERRSSENSKGYGTMENIA
ncbi:uncharacterized protein LOC132720469 [Ruditapes philippinarum]|uniref:uncharacterized protein LOC132720469 n=1 Tax=Ruditapes philippinarum TaxID=129788 RepID=UPI00295BEC33|nr:uncharacterized protein LOC132720469 [Ruditapes philippinarum]